MDINATLEVKENCIFRNILSQYTKEHLVELVIELTGHDEARTITNHIEQENK